MYFLYITIKKILFTYNKERIEYFVYSEILFLISY